MDAKSKSRVITVSITNTQVTLSGLYIKNGYPYTEGNWGAGGGIRSVANLMLTNSIFENNSAGQSGGGLKIGDNNGVTATAEIKNCTFINNRAGLYDNTYSAAGAFILYPGDSSYVIVDNCTFIGNSLEKDFVNPDNATQKNHAGAICLNSYNEKSKIINSIFINNTAPEGGAITPHKGGYIENCTFEGNNATVRYGGAISMLAEASDTELIIKNCTFKNNNAPNGAAMYTKENENTIPVTISDSVFNTNVATDNGGGVYIEGSNAQV